MFVSGIQENGKNVEDNQPKRGMIGDCDCGCSTSVAQTEEDFALYRKAVESYTTTMVRGSPARKCSALAIRRWTTDTSRSSSDNRYGWFLAVCEHVRHASRATC